MAYLEPKNEAKIAGIGLNRGRFLFGLGENVNLIFKKEAKMETSNLVLESLIQGFRLSCQAEGKSPRTIEWYITFLTRFQRYLEANGFPTDLGQITRDYIRAFILYLQAT